MKKLEEYVRSIPDFPEPGIIFRDVTSILQDADGLQLAIDSIQEKLKDVDVDVIAGTESRGFIFGVPVAYNLHKPFVPIRKKGKLPCETISQDYDLEYGSATIEMHKDSVKPGQKVVLIDDLVATGGTIEAAAKMVERLGGEVVQMIANPVTREQRVVGAVLLLINETEKVEREQLRREFSANVSHELMTPLTAVSGFAEIIRNGMVRQEDVQKFAGRIYDEAQRLIALIEDTIRVSQLDEGETPYDWEDLDVCQIVRDVCGRLKEIADKKNVHFYIDGDKTMLYSVRPILDEIIYNLCDNGIKYNKEDGTVSIHLRDLGKQVEIRVKDNGIGIPAEDQKRVFERFYRVDKSHSKASGGTGLGLSIVKHAVAYHHGTIALKSEVGKGTEIAVRFPQEK